MERFGKTEQDVVWAIQEGVASSYSELHALLRVYPAACIASAVNSLLDEGALRLGTEGFEIPPAEERDSARSPRSADACGIATQEPSTACAGAEEGESEEPLDAASSIDAEDSVDLKDHEDPQHLEDSEDPEDVEKPESLFEASKGSILAMTPVAFLGFPDHLLRDLRAQGIESVFQLVERVPKLGAVIGKDRLALVLKRLSDLSGDPPVKLSTDDRHQLSVLSGSNLMYFDWFGVLCSDISPELDEHEIRERLDDDSYNTRYEDTFSFAAFRSVYQPTSVDADQKLFELFGKRGYPVNGDAFHIIMLPTVEELVDESGYDDPNELAHELLVTFVDRQTTENACFGLLRDRFLSLKARTDGLGSSERIQVGTDECFARAARRLSELEPSCHFDEDRLALQCLPNGKSRIR